MMKRILSILLISFLILPAISQSKKYKPEKPKESIVAEWPAEKVVHYIGLRGGYGLGLQRFEPNKNNVTQTGLFNIGLAYRFDVPRQKYVGCIEFDLEYLQKGFGYETYTESGIIYSRKYSVIMLPILWQPYLPLGKKGSRFYLNLGPYLSYTINGGTYRYYDRDSGETMPGEDSEGDYEYDTLRDNYWEYGCPLGAGFVIAVGKSLTLGIDFRYNINLSDVMKGVNKYASNPFRSPVDQMNISFGVNYRIPSLKKKQNLEDQK